MVSTPPRIFAPQIRAAKRARAARIAPIDTHFLMETMADELAERLAWVTRTFDRVAMIGPVAGHAARFGFGEVDAYAFSNAEPGRVIADEQLLSTIAGDDDFAAAMARYDCIIAAPLPDAINDMPGFLTQIRLALKPDGLFLGAMFAAGSLPTLRATMQAADDGRGVARLHPMADLRALGDLMQRTGFALPVVDEARLTLTYADPIRALADLRGLGQGNALASQTPFGGKAALARALSAWQEAANADGRVAEQVVMAHLSGWAPSPDQPKPARRGSATTSLAAALKSAQDDQAE